MRMTKLTLALLTLLGLAFVAIYFGGQNSRAATLDDPGVKYSLFKRLLQEPCQDRLLELVTPR